MEPSERRRWATGSLAVTFVVAAVLGSGCGDLTQGELDRGIGTLQSAAAEGSIIARQVAEDRTKTTFARVRSRELGEDVEHEAEKLADATAAEDQVKRRDTAVGLAEKIGDALEVIQAYPEDERRGAEAESDLEGLAQMLSDLKERE